MYYGTYGYLDVWYGMEVEMVASHLIVQHTVPQPRRLSTHKTARWSGVWCGVVLLARPYQADVHVCVRCICHAQVDRQTDRQNELVQYW